MSDIFESLDIGYKDLIILFDYDKIIGFCCIYDSESGFIAMGFIIKIF